MANPDGNKEIAKEGENTQFKEGNDAAAKGGRAKKAAFDIREQQRRLAAFEIDGMNPNAADLAKAFHKEGAKKQRLTVAQLAAIISVKQAVENHKAMNALIDNVSGKQVQKTVEAKVTLADIINGNVEAMPDDEE